MVTAFPNSLFIKVRNRKEEKLQGRRSKKIRRRGSFLEGGTRTENSA